MEVPQNWCVADDGKILSLADNVLWADLQSASTATVNFQGNFMSTQSVYTDPEVDIKKFSAATIAILKDALGYGDAIVKCGHCGQWGAVKTACKHCGAAVG